MNGQDGYVLSNAVQSRPIPPGRRKWGFTPLKRAILPSGGWAVQYVQCINVSFAYARGFSICLKPESPPVTLDPLDVTELTIKNGSLGVSTVESSVQCSQITLDVIGRWISNKIVEPLAGVVGDV